MFQSLVPSWTSNLIPYKWIRSPNQPAQDGFTIRRKGDTPTKVRIVMHLEQQPEQYKVHPELGVCLATKSIAQEFWFMAMSYQATFWE